MDRDGSQRLPGFDVAAPLGRLLDDLPAAAYACDADGRITCFNARAVELWGRAPRLDHPADRFCGSARLLTSDGHPVRHDESAMARVLREPSGAAEQAFVIERPDGSRRPVRLSANPVLDDSGRLTGAIGLLIDVTPHEPPTPESAAFWQSEQRFARFMQHLPGLAWIKDVEGRYIFVNDAAERAFQKARAELYGRTDEEIFPPDTAQLFRENDRRALELGVGIETVETLEHDDGLHHSLVAKFPIPGRDGGAPLVGGMAIDITQRIEMEKALQAAETAARLAREELESITDVMSARVIRCSADLRYLWVSRAYASWRGRSPAEIVGRPIAEILGQQAFETIRSYVVRVLAGERLEYEVRLPYPDLGQRWIHAAFVPTYASTQVPDGFVAVITDITARKELEEALRESNTLLEQRASENRQTAESVISLKNELEAQLEDLRLLHGLSVRLSTTLDLQTILDETLRTAAAIEGASLGLISLASPDGTLLEVGARLGFSSELLALFDHAAPGGGACGTAFREQRRVIVEDTETDPLFEAYREAARTAGFRAVHCTPLLARSGRIIGVLSTHFREPHRPSDRETHLVDLCARQAVDFIENARLYGELREADRRKDEFLATLAHELRNPLAPLSNALTILRLSDELPPAMERVREVMQHQVDHLVRLVDDLLEVSRITSGKIELRKEPLDLVTVIGSAVETSRPLIDSFAHQLAISISPEPMRIEGDAVRLAQIFTNLLNNAAKYTERSGQIWLTARREEGDAVISVRDNGMGITAEMLPRVFDMFAQVDRTLTHAHGGLGIGLTLARNLVQMHGGRIEVRSDGPGCGSEFTVRLPLCRASVPVKAPAVAPRAGLAGLPSWNVLVIDDTRAAAHMLSRLLEALGQNVRTANDGATALRLAGERAPDIVFSDIAMPEMDGYEFARRLRREPGLERVVLVALTGYGQDSDRQRASAAGFDQYLVKPASLDDLERVLGRVLTARPDMSARR